MKTCPHGFRQLLLVAAILLLAGTGCTHTQLRKNTVRQAWTLGDIHQQQVLNNLAMFVYDSNSFPSFAIPNQGGSNVTDTGNTTMTPGFSRAGGPFQLNTFGLSFGAARQAQESFTMTPVNDPRKLELMRCAYQQAVAGCGRGEVSENCPDCQALMKRFYTGDPDGDIAKTNGIVTSECRKPVCWFGWGCKKCVPKHCPCTYVGEYCGYYVWVLPEGRGELSKLTLSILDYAVNNSPTLRTKEVSYNIDQYGLPTTDDKSVGRVTAQINIDEKPGSLLNASAPDTARLEQILKARLQEVVESISRLDGNPQLNEAAKGDLRRQLINERQGLEQKLQYINEQFRTGALKEKFFPPSQSQTPSSLLLPFNLQQDTLTPGRPAPF